MVSQRRTMKTTNLRCLPAFHRFIHPVDMICRHRRTTCFRKANDHLTRSVKWMTWYNDHQILGWWSTFLGWMTPTPTHTPLTNQNFFKFGRLLISPRKFDQKGNIWSGGCEVRRVKENQTRPSCKAHVLLFGVDELRKYFFSIGSK